MQIPLATRQIFTVSCALMHRLNWSDLQFVLAVATHGSLAAAGRALGVNHATVQRRIEKFEAAQKIRIFDRTPLGYRVGAESQPVVAALRAMAASAEGFERIVAGQGSAFGGRLHLTTTDSLAGTVLPPHLAGFRAAYPEVELELTVTNSRLDLARLDADLSIRPAADLSDDLVGERVGEMVFRAYGAPAVLARGTGIAHGDWIGTGALLARSPVAAWERERLPAEAIRLRASSFVAMAHAAAAGLGLAMLPVCVAERVAGIAPAEDIEDRLGVGIWVACHRDLITSQRIRAFLGHFTEALSGDPTLGGGGKPSDPA